jgi:hypothetical protein
MSPKNVVVLWYEAFNRKDPALLDKILSESWMDIPPAPDQPRGPADAKPLLAELTTVLRVAGSRSNAAYGMRSPRYTGGASCA